MIDTERLKQDANLFALVVQDTMLKQKAKANGGEWAGPCPFCGGRDRFVVQPNDPNGGRWLCRNCTDGKWQDAIEYVMRRDNVEFKEACRILGGNHTRYEAQAQYPAKKPAKLPQEIFGPPSAEWQEKANAICEECFSILWSDRGKAARDWLNARGLKNDTVQAFLLGYNPQDRELNGLFTRRGITIPCTIDGNLWSVNVRRPVDGQGKYKAVAGSKLSAPYGISTLASKDVAVVCEGQFDMMLAWQEIGDFVGVMTLVSAKNRLNVSMWARYLLPVKRFFITYDLDAAGKKGSEALSSLSQRFTKIEVPKRKEGDNDLTDFWKSGGDLEEFFAEQFVRHLQGSRRPDNPDTIFKEYLSEVNSIVAQHEGDWDELVESVRKGHPRLVGEYEETYGRVDCDIYGRWKLGLAGRGEIEQFRKDVLRWRDLLKSIVEKYQGIPTGVAKRIHF